MRLALLSVLQLAAITLAAQSDTFQIKDYRFRTPGFSALQVNFGIGGTLSHDRRLDGGRQEERAFLLQPSELTYYRISSTDRKLHTSSISFEPSVFLSTNEREGSGKSSVANLYAQLRWSFTTQYFRKDNWFWEVGNQLLFDGLRNSQTDTAGLLRRSDLTVSEGVTFGFGKGRIERVQDAQTALFILNDLKQQGLFDLPFTKEQALELSRLITDINNRRVFDFRRRRIYELTRLDSFFRQSGLAKTTDIRHFSVINDNWSFGLNPYRLSGWQWFLRMTPGLTFSRTSQLDEKPSPDQKFVTRQLTFQLLPEVGFEKQVASSMKWQHGYGSSLSYALNWINQKSFFNHTLTDEQKGLSDLLSLQAFFSLSYYPNNRTILTSRAEIRATDALDRPAYRSIEPSLQFQMNYFLGYRTSLLAYVAAAHQYLEFPGAPSIRRQTHVSFSIGLSHFLF